MTNNLKRVIFVCVWKCELHIETEDLFLKTSTGCQQTTLLRFLTQLKWTFNELKGMWTLINFDWKLNLHQSWPSLDMSVIQSFHFVPQTWEAAETQRQKRSQTKHGRGKLKKERLQARLEFLWRWRGASVNVCGCVWACGCLWIWIFVIMVTISIFEIL